jgi:hypothetical protein
LQRSPWVHIMEEFTTYEVTSPLLI